VMAEEGDHNNEKKGRSEEILRERRCFLRELPFVSSRNKRTRVAGIGCPSPSLISRQLRASAMGKADVRGSR